MVFNGFCFIFKVIIIMKKLLGVLVGVAPVAAFAAVPEAVSTAITTAGVDGATMAGAVLLVIVTFFGIKILRKAL